MATGYSTGQNLAGLSVAPQLLALVSFLFLAWQRGTLRILFSSGGSVSGVGWRDKPPPWGAHLPLSLCLGPGLPSSQAARPVAGTVVGEVSVGWQEAGEAGSPPRGGAALAGVGAQRDALAQLLGGPEAT